MKILLKILSVTVIIGMLFSLAGCSTIARKISNEAKSKISEGLQDAMDEESESEDEVDSDDEDEDKDETEPSESRDDSDSDSNDNNDDSTAITTGEGKGMEWPAENMGPIDPVSCKISSVFTDDASGFITFEGMQREEADQYIEDFDAMGFTSGFITDDDAGLLFVKTNDAGDAIMFAYSPEGTGTLSYTPASES